MVTYEAMTSQCGRSVVKEPGQEVNSSEQM